MPSASCCSSSSQAAARTTPGRSTSSNACMKAAPSPRPRLSSTTSIPRWSAWSPMPRPQPGPPSLVCAGRRGRVARRRSSGRCPRSGRDAVARDARSRRRGRGAACGVRSGRDGMCGSRCDSRRYARAPCDRGPARAARPAGAAARRSSRTDPRHAGLHRAARRRGLWVRTVAGLSKLDGEERTRAAAVERAVDRLSCGDPILVPDEPATAGSTVRSATAVVHRSSADADRFATTRARHKRTAHQLPDGAHRVRSHRS